jgi:hypothetical protein
LDEKNWFTSETKAAKTSKAAENRDQQIQQSSKGDVAEYKSGKHVGFVAGTEIKDGQEFIRMIASNEFLARGEHPSQYKTITILIPASELNIRRADQSDSAIAAAHAPTTAFESSSAATTLTQLQQPRRPVSKPLDVAQWQQPDKGKQISVNSNIGSDINVAMASMTAT